MSKLAAILGATLVAVVASYQVLRVLGTSSGFPAGSAWIVAAAMVSLWLKILLQDQIFNNLRLDKQGYFCVLTLGTALTTFAAEYAKHSLNVDRTSALFAIFVSALVGTLLTGANSRAIEAAQRQNPPLKVRAEALKNIAGFIFGVIFLMMNIGVLLTKP